MGGTSYMDELVPDVLEESSTTTNQTPESCVSGASRVPRRPDCVKDGSVVVFAGDFGLGTTQL